MIEVGSIKSKFLSIVIFIFTVTCLFFVFFVEESEAVNQAEVSFFGEPKYVELSSIVKNDKIIGKTFQINVTLHNSGDLRSDGITVNLTDQEGFTLRRDVLYIDPGKTEIASFIWSTTNIRNQQIIVSFYPTNLKTAWDDYNSGSTTLTIKIADEGGVPATSTPGFEILVFLFAVATLMFFIRKNR